MMKEIVIVICYKQCIYILRYNMSTSISIILINTPERDSAFHHPSSCFTAPSFYQVPSGFHPSNQHRGLLAALLLGQTTHPVGIRLAFRVAPCTVFIRCYTQGIQGTAFFSSAWAEALVCSTETNFDQNNGNKTTKHCWCKTIFLP